MIDLDLLRKAAKATGMRPGSWWDGWSDEGRVAGAYWNPLDDDGDALRLAAACGIECCVRDGKGRARSPREDAAGYFVTYEVTVNGDPCAALRRAIVEAAASLSNA